MRGLILFAALSLAAPAAASNLQAAYVIMADGGPVARVITSAAECPAIRIDGRLRPMTMRAPAATVIQRPTASKPELSKPSAYPVTVCESALPRTARHASIEGRVLPIPRRAIRRIVVIGDTGCRLKAADNAYQPCNDPAATPFATIAASAVRWKPDLVVHVGDYQYRENPCPEGNVGCAGSPWGYGWDAWNADFFAPAAPLFAAAPLALARGNHESCNRAGQGWQRFLDGHAATADRNCDDPANDHAGDVGTPYAVDLGQGARLIMMDFSGAGGKALAEDDWRRPVYTADFAAVARLAKGARFAFAVDHYPLLGFAAEKDADKPALKQVNLALQSAFGPLSPRYAPPGVDVLLAGHVHVWQQISFKGNHPSQFVTGFSGTLEDVVPIPVPLPEKAEPAPGAKVAHFSSWVDGFGYMTLERTGRRTWQAVVRDRNGKPLNRCRIEGRRSVCEKGMIETQ